MTTKFLFDEQELDQTKQATAHLNQFQSKAKTIADYSSIGVNPLVDIKIVIEGIECKGFKEFKLQQSIQDHHTFVLLLPYHALGENETYQMEQTQELLGKRMVARFTYKYGEEKPERDFIGIITEVSFEQSRANRGDIILTGYSPTILLDRAPHIQSFGGKDSISLPAIVRQLIEEGYAQKGKYNYLIQSQKALMLPYSCQYNETAYNYVARMAEVYGEPFFYDGEVLHFGALPQIETPITLTYGRNVEQIKVCMAAQHVNRELYGYNSLDHERLSAIGDTNLQAKGTLAQYAYEQSQRVFTAPSVQIAPMNAVTDQDITEAQKELIGRVGSNVFVISGTTTVPFLYPGCIVELRMYHSQERENHFFTKLMITQISHEVDALGTYKGYFEAVDAETGSIPNGTHQKPVVEQQIATVINNTDPQNKGRVQVRFDWQNTDLNTNFIRVMAPDAGSSATVDTNRGFVAIPEVGDQVLIGFMNQHPDQPFVMGGLFHGKIAAGGGKENSIKSWSTKSGHIIELDDQGGIKIIDKKKNVIQLDGEGRIDLQSAKSIVLQSGKSSLVLEENGKVYLEGVELSIKGEIISNVANQKLVAQSGDAVLTLDAEENEAVLSAKSSIVNGSSTATVNGGLDAKLTASGTASIEGAIVKLN